jgi:hypothetical protein
MRWWLVVLCLAGCERSAAPAGARYQCRCSALTDTDQAVTRNVAVCARSDDAADKSALGCARSQAQLSVQSCKCKPAAGQCGDSCEADPGISNRGK